MQAGPDAHFLRRRTEAVYRLGARCASRTDTLTLVAETRAPRGPLQQIRCVVSGRVVKGVVLNQPGKRAAELSGHDPGASARLMRPEAG